MIFREMVIELVPDRHWKSKYFLYDDMGMDGGPRIQILYLENAKTKTRTVEAVNHRTPEDPDNSGWDADLWFDDVRVIIEHYLPPKISFNQFVGKLAIALKLVPPDYDCSYETIPEFPGQGDTEPEADDDENAWTGPILRQIVAALPEVKH